MNCSNAIGKFEDNRIICSEETVTLYHGSKSGISGTIKPLSRDKCDFGKGFYMGTDRSQPLTLICNYPESKLYTLELNLSGLKVIDIEVGLDWALLVAFNRGKMEAVKNTPIYKKYLELSSSCDIIIGYIADDRMFVVLDRFFNGDITDMALINSLSALNLGKQYAAITSKACEQIKILKQEVLSDHEREILKQESRINRSKGIDLAEKICLEYRREGRYFDEILKAGG